MGFQWYICICICRSVKTESVVTQGKQSEEHAGVNGCPGVPGRDGRDGRDGIQGPYGAPGLPGNVGMSSEFERKFEEIIAEVEKLKDAVENGLTSLSNGRIDQRTEYKPVNMSREDFGKTQEQPSTGGATYVRWGRNDCPPKTLKLYSGFVAGSLYTQSGSGANHVCLPMDPQWNKTVAGHQSGGRLYGTEFELYETNSGFHRNNAGGKSQHDHDAQCAVCQTTGRLTQLMIPARLECPSGWNLEYLGFLMSGHYAHKRSEYVCVDQDPDVDPASSANKNGNLFYQVEVACGSLPCPPYVDGYEVTCAVCTQ